jgi:hypothetical protein
MVEKPDQDEAAKTETQALSVAQKFTLHSVDVITNNKHLVDEAFKFALAESSSLSGDEESSGQDQEQEGGDKDGIEEDS